jgi:hypothetical protein
VADLDWIGDKLRMGGAMGRAMALLFGFVVMFLFLPRPKDDPVVERTTANGVVAIVPGEALPADARSWVALVRLPDGRSVRVIFSPPKPADGMPVPLLVERHRSGDTRYFLDVERWRAR